MSANQDGGLAASDLPNAITVARMVAVVPLVWLLLAEHFVAALWVAFIAGISDGIDGFLAKRFHWETRLGGILDPLADKLLLVACYGVLALEGSVPLWLFGLVVLRDLVIVAGGTAFHYLVRSVDAEPLFLSKFNTCAQIVQVLSILVGLAYGWRHDLFDEALVWIVAVTTVGSGLQYIIVWGRRALSTPQEEHHE